MSTAVSYGMTTSEYQRSAVFTNPHSTELELPFNLYSTRCNYYYFRFLFR